MQTRNITISDEACDYVGFLEFYMRRLGFGVQEIEYVSEALFELMFISIPSGKLR